MSGARDDWRIQRTAGIGLIAAAVFIAVTRENAETIAGTLLAFGVLLLGVKVPSALPFVGRKDEK